MYRLAAWSLLPSVSAEAVSLRGYEVKFRFLGILISSCLGKTGFREILRIIGIG